MGRKMAEFICLVKEINKPRKIRFPFSLSLLINQSFKNKTTIWLIFLQMTPPQFFKTFTGLNPPK